MCGAHAARPGQSTRLTVTPGRPGIRPAPARTTSRGWLNWLTNHLTCGRRWPVATTTAGTWPAVWGATATMVATAGRSPPGERPLVNDPFADPLVRAVGVTPFVAALDGQNDIIESGSSRVLIDVVAVRTKFFDDFLHGRRRPAAGGHPGLRTGLLRLPAGLARRHHRVRDRDQPR